MSEESTSPDLPTPLDADSIAKAVRDSTREAFQEVLQASPPPQRPAPVEQNPFAEFINPLVEPRIRAASLQGEAAQDKVDFYTSDEWLLDIDDHLGSTPEEVKAAKAEVRAEVEKTFTDMLRAGKGTFRKDILSYVMYERIKKNKTKFNDTVAARAKRKAEADIETARRGVDIATTTAMNFSREDIEKLSDEDMMKQFGDLAF